MLCILYERGSDCKSLKHKGLRLRPEGIEPPTYGLEIRCSIQLSYERITPAFYQSIFLRKAPRGVRISNQSKQPHNRYSQAAVRWECMASYFLLASHTTT